MLLTSHQFKLWGYPILLFFRGILCPDFRQLKFQCCKDGPLGFERACSDTKIPRALVLNCVGERDHVWKTCYKQKIDIYL
ncbi:hypothetical protein O6P43_025067 [Quillaja saponaria]|uniref:Uncharacterized protein n=1 Tax=Quillaja saponaria TaxID=32244 RepID=A0AAD7PF63_QUISA|nr:hypothetical protein O6P43_025067 [Quillaja saponaria]